MSDVEQVTCGCGKTLAAHGMAGHLRSKAHQAWEEAQESTEIPEDLADLADVASDDVIVDDDAPSGIPGVSRGDLEAIVAELEKENAQLREHIKDIQPFIEVLPYQNVEDVIEHLGADHVEMIGEIALANENKKRMAAGRRPLYDDDRQHYDKMVKQFGLQAVKEMVAQQTSWTQGVADGNHQQLRTFKMVAPTLNCDKHDLAIVDQCYEHTRSVQIPVELQINNGAASLNDPIERYKRKGFKAMAPLRCKLVDCWAAQAVDGNGKPAFNGYCSQLHHRFIEGAVLETGVEGRNPVTIVGDYAGR